jgi:TRAP-type transport system periplasmic protein
MANGIIHAMRFFMVLAIFPCYLVLSTVDSAYSAEKIVIKLGSGAGPGSFMGITEELYKKKVEEKTQGQVEIKLFPSNQLGTLTAQQEGLRVGTHQMAVIGSSIVALAPKFGIFDFPFIFDDREEVGRVVNGSIGKELMDSLLPKGLVGLGFFENGITHMTNNVRPIRKPADCVGLKMRTPESPSRILIFRTYGANPTPMDFGELFSALKQGVVDGQDNPYSNIIMGKLFEVQKYLSNTGHVYSSVILIASKIWWEKWPKDVQKILQETAIEVANESRKRGEETDKRNLESLKKQMQVNEVDKEEFKKASMPVYKELGKSVGEDLLERVRQATK